MINALILALPMLLSGMDDKAMLDQLQIHTVLLDVDDTLVRTSAVFHKWTAIALERLSTGHNIPMTEISSVLGPIEREGRSIFCVNSELLWPWMFNRLFAQFGINNPDDEVTCARIALSAYQELPEIIPGTVEALRFLRSAGRKIGYVTHAPPEWTGFKLEGQNIMHYADHIEYWDVGIPKDAQVWRNALSAMSVNPEFVLAVGDSLTGDIQAAGEAGIRHRVWLNHPDGWSFSRQGEFPAGVWELQTLAELPQLLKQEYENHLRLR